MPARRPASGSDAAAFFAVVHPALPALRSACGSIVAVTTAATDRHPVRDGRSTAPEAAGQRLDVDGGYTA
jgi:hypothetical protein